MVHARKDLEILSVPLDRPTITVGDIRLLCASMAVKPLKTRVIIIAGAERLTGPAASALLKRLEEPSRQTRYLLTSMFPRRLFPTLLSRCQRIRLAGLPVTAPAADEILQVAAELQNQFREHGPSRDLRVAFQRLRDYYQIVSLRGNEKMAREVLFASLPPRGTS
jgi:hypothetical protein